MYILNLSCSCVQFTQILWVIVTFPWGKRGCGGGKVRAAITFSFIFLQTTNSRGKVTEITAETIVLATGMHSVFERNLVYVTCIAIQYVFSDMLISNFR